MIYCQIFPERAGCRCGRLDNRCCPHAPTVHPVLILETGEIAGRQECRLARLTRPVAECRLLDEKPASSISWRRKTTRACARRWSGVPDAGARHRRQAARSGTCHCGSNTTGSAAQSERRSRICCNFPAQVLVTDADDLPQAAKTAFGNRSAPGSSIALGGTPTILGPRTCFRSRPPCRSPFTHANCTWSKVPNLEVGNCLTKASATKFAPARHGASVTPRFPGPAYH